jgi:hypothetical protein
MSYSELKTDTPSGVRVWIIDRQSFGLRGLIQFGIGRNKRQSGKTIARASALQLGRGCKVERIRAAQRRILNVVESVAGQQQRGDFDHTKFVGKCMTELVDTQSGFCSREVSGSRLACQERTIP